MYYYLKVKDNYFEFDNAFKAFVKIQELEVGQDFILQSKPFSNVEQLRILIKSKMTFKEFARELNMNYLYLIQILNKKVEMPLQVRQKIVDYFKDKERI